MSAPRRIARQYRLIVILGAPGAGKSSLTEELIRAWTRERQGRGELRILDPTTRNWSHLGGEWPDDGPDDYRAPAARAEAWIKELRRERIPRPGASRDHVPPGLVVLEDADVYLSGGQPRDVWRDFFAMFRHWRTDVIVIARRTQDLPKLILTAATYACIFIHREAYSVDYLRRYIGRSAAKEVPREPFRYLEVAIDEGTHAIKRTKRRPDLHAADLA